MEKQSLTALAGDQLRAARQASSGRSAHTIYGGHDHQLRQTLLTLTANNELAEHDGPGEATLLVLQGHVQLTSGQDGSDGKPGDHLVIPPPPARHALRAIEDSVVLLTIVTSPGAN